ncbi:Uncharacterised protein [Bordetella ansorpii]|uniref:Uncharacterized protein n=1 Tax=Bordetella ansorpii TaxID=288768 RepID=A0A157S8H1_9BORD|nr:Uncharacterised protein [Bordetella ansorpii]
MVETFANQLATGQQHTRYIRIQCIQGRDHAGALFLRLTAMQQEQRLHPPNQSSMQCVKMLSPLGQGQHLAILCKSACDFVGNRRGTSHLVSKLAEYVLDGRIFGKRSSRRQIAWHTLQHPGRTSRFGSGMANRATLHEQNGLTAIAPDWCCCQPQYVTGADTFENGLKRHCREVMAFVDNDLSVIFHNGIGFSLPMYGLHDGDVNAACRFGLSAADHADHLLAATQESLQTFLPLPEQFRAMHQYQRIDATPGDQRRGGDGFSEGGGCAQDAGIEAEHRSDGLLLVFTELACERNSKGLAAAAFVPQFAADSVLTQ